MGSETPQQVACRRAGVAATQQSPPRALLYLPSSLPTGLASWLAEKAPNGLC